MSSHFYLAILLATVMVSSIPASDFRIPIMPTPPKIDGVIVPAEWAVSAGFTGFTNEGRVRQRRASAWLGATEDHIYVAIRSQLPDAGALQAGITTDNPKVVFDDAVEVFINPTPDSADRVEYQMLANSAGKRGYNIDIRGNAKEDVAWDGKWEMASSQHDGVWDFECAIPIHSMSAVGKDRKTTDGAWQLNLCRDWKNPWEWSALGEGYSNKGLLIEFTKQPAPAVQYTNTRDIFVGDCDGALNVLNPGTQPLEVTASLVLERNNMPELHAEKTLKLAPAGDTSVQGEKQSVALDLKGDLQTAHFKLHAQVKSADGQTVFYDRTTNWSRAAAYKWVANQEQKKPPLDFKFAYFPSGHSLRVRVDTSGMPKDAGLESIVVTVSEKAGKQVAAESVKADSLKDGGFDLALLIPELNGEGEIEVQSQGKTKSAIGKTVKSFERKAYPWENSTIGKSTEVYPPFTRFKVNKPAKTISTVLREHTVNDFGVWDQVVATSPNTGVAKAILAAPMRFRVKSGGSELKLSGTNPSIRVIRDDMAFTEGKFGSYGENVSGPINPPSVLDCSYGCTWQCDGTATIQLKLGSPAHGVIDEFTLEIPFTPETATLMHANSDRIRAPIAGPIPQGEGVVWDASKLACDDYIKNFCPYIYIGTANRGICWFAENDKGWGWNPKTPNLEVVRENGQVILRVHLINQPTKLDLPRTISFGLLAAPVKPRLVPLAQPPGSSGGLASDSGGALASPQTDAGKPVSRPNENYWRYRYLRDKYCLLGTDINWLSMGTCGDVYPAGKDLHYWEELAKGNTQQIADDEVKAVADSGLKYFQQYGKGSIDSWNHHVGHNLRAHLGQDMIYYYNRASYEACEEFKTFGDEWTCDQWRDDKRPANSLDEIKVVPSKSYIDFCLYWYAKSFEVGRNKGVYWDNWFIAPSFNTQMTDAFVRADGTVSPAAGINGLRELARRTFVMMNERKMLPITFPHMTSFSCLPMLSFATMQYDWEWKFGLGDFQDRYPREYILLATNGELAGTWPVALHEISSQDQDAWVMRTFVAVRLVHELDGIGGVDVRQKPQQANLKLVEPVLAMLDKPGLKVYRYWDERPQPVKCSNADIPTIIYSVPGKEAVVVATSYSRQDEQVVLQVDAPALGFEKDWTVTNTETGQAMTTISHEAGVYEVVFPLKKHDLCVMHFEAKR